MRFLLSRVTFALDSCDEKHESLQAKMWHVAEHRPSISPARLGHSNLMMRMPFADIAKTFLRCNQRANLLQVLDVLMKRCRSSLAVLARSDELLDDDGSLVLPQTKQIAPGFDIWIMMHKRLDFFIISVVNIRHDGWIPSSYSEFYQWFCIFAPGCVSVVFFSKLPLKENII